MSANEPAADARSYSAGYAAGIAAASAKLSEIINAPSIKGRPAKISAALDLLVDDPSVAASTIIRVVGKYTPHGGPSGVASLANRARADGDQALGGADQSGEGSGGRLLALAKAQNGEIPSATQGGRLTQLARDQYGDPDAPGAA